MQDSKRILRKYSTSDKSENWWLIEILIAENGNKIEHNKIRSIQLSNECFKDLYVAHVIAMVRICLIVRRWAVLLKSNDNDGNEWWNEWKMMTMMEKQMKITN